MLFVQAEGVKARAVNVSAGWLIAVVCLVGSGARAEFSPVVFDVQASSSLGTGYFQVMFEQGEFDPVSGRFEWTLQAPLVIQDEITGASIATLAAASVSYVEDPVVNVSFDVFAGAADTLFLIGSGLLGFGPIDPAQGRASAAMTATDVNDNGAVLTGTGPGGMAYLAQYNGIVPGGTTFAALIPGVVAPAGESRSEFANFPGGGAFMDIPDPVVDMSALFSFTLTTNDFASGTSNYEIIPEPGAITLLALGIGVGVIRRKRRT
ncbi:MAG: PEP-CTERM sorting domain-containing protein [Planctomycetota bacterium]|jgi:hypothetical protein